jgi:integrase
MEKPQKPRPDFPLFPHQNGQWAKKIDGKLRYFGKWDDFSEAESRYKAFVASPLQQKPKEITLHAIRLKDLVNAYLTDCQLRVARKEMAQVTLNAYRDFFKRFFSHTDKLTLLHAVDWGRAAKKQRAGKAHQLSPSSWVVEITKLKTCLNWAKDRQLIDAIPELGPGWKKPSQRSVRKTAKQFRAWFDREEIIKLLDHCTKTSRLALRAMILLGVNAGLGNHDCASLRPQNVDLERGWLVFPRNKTGVARKSKLWPETVQALRDYADVRPRVKTDWVFVTIYGNQYTRPDQSHCVINKQFREVCQANMLWIPRRGFYGLRRTCATIGGESTDQAAVNAIMGHLDTSTPGIYRQAISDARLERVSETIRAWLYQIE